MGPASRKKNLALAPWPQLALGRKIFFKSDPTDFAIQRNLNSSYHNLSSPRRPPAAANAARPKNTKRACLCHRQLASIVCFIAPDSVASIYPKYASEPQMPIPLDP